MTATKETGLDLEGLRKKAQAATPGDWGLPLDGFDFEKMYNPDEFHTVITQAAITVDGINPLVHVFGFGWAGSNEDADAAFIAAANPQTVLALLDKIDSLDAQHEDCLSVLEDTQAALAAALADGGA